MPIKALLILAIGAFGMFAYYTYNKKQENKEFLLEHGERVIATVTEKLVSEQDYRPSRHRHKTTYKDTKHHYLALEFSASNGDIIMGKMWVQPDTYANYEVDDSISVAFDPNNPQNVMPKDELL